MPDLPPELLYELLPQCNNATLCALALVSRSMRKDVEKLLYNFIHLDSSQRCADLVAAIESTPQHAASDTTQQQMDLGITTQDAALDTATQDATLDTTPRHAALVQSLRLLGVKDRSLCTELLLKLPGLKRLNTTLWCDGFSYPVDGFPFRLRRLRIFDNCDGLDSNALVEFLDEQDELEVFELVASTPDRRWGWLCSCARDSRFPKMLPQLKSFQAPLGIIFAFLSCERPELREIKVQTRTADLAPSDESQDEEAVQELCSAISETAVNVRSLTLGTLDAVRTIRDFASTCPGLRSLELMVYRRGTFDKFVTESQADHPAVPSSLLKRFVLHVVGTPYEETLESDHLHSSFVSDIAPWLRRMLPNLDECEMVLHAGEDMNPTLYAPEEYMRAPSSYVPDWHVLHGEFYDQEFFCGN